MTELRLTAPTSVVNDIQQVTGGTAGVDEFALRSNVTTVTPTIHLGGSGYFFKLDLPISFGSSFSMVGLGLYPINIGIYFDHLAMFPYVSFGAVANVVTSHRRRIRHLQQADRRHRPGAGGGRAEVLPLHGLALSGELGFSPWTAGAVALPPESSSGSDATRFEGDSARCSTSASASSGFERLPRHRRT